MEDCHKKMQFINVVDIEKRRVPSKHYVFVLEITWADGTQNVIYRRYSQFFILQTSLIDAFPVEGGVRNPSERILPFLPGKVLFRSHVREVALKRKSALEEYCKKLIKLPEHILHSEYVTSFFEATQEDIGSLTSSLTDDNKRRKSEKRADVISEPVLLEQYLALADFKKTGRGQINMVAGDIVDVIEKTDNGWYFVSLDDEQGWVPSSYLEPVQGADQEATVEKCLTEEKFVCVKPYKASFDDEMDLELGSIVVVLQKGSDGWWQVRYRGKEGWAPRAYLKSASHLSLATTAPNADVVKDKGAIQEKGKLGVAPPPRRRTVKRTISAEVKRASIKRSRSNNLSSDCKYVALSDYQMKIGKSEVCIPQGKTFELIEKAPNGWSLIKIGNEEGWVPSDLLAKQRKGAIAIFEEGEDIYQNVKSVIIEDIDKIEEKSDEPNNNYISEKYVTIGAFTSNDESGISFNEGVELEVLEKNKTGWWFIRIGKDEGWAPSTYLSPVAPKKVVSNSKAESDQQLDIAVPPPKPNRRSEIPQSYENVVDRKPNVTPPPKPTTPPAKPKTPSPVNAVGESQLRVSAKPAVTKRPVSPNPKPRASPGLVAQIAELKKTMNKGSASPTPQPRNLQRMRQVVSVDESQIKTDRKTPPPKPIKQPVRKISEPAKAYRKTPANISNGRKHSEQVTTQMRLSPAIPERPNLESLNLYVTKASYVDNDDGMLSFEAGEKVEVLEKDEGGWWFARIGLKKGWVPSNFLQKMS